MGEGRRERRGIEVIGAGMDRLLGRIGLEDCLWWCCCRWCGGECWRMRMICWH